MSMRVMYRDEALMLPSEDHEPATPSLAGCAGETSANGGLWMHDLLDGQKIS